MYNRVLEFLAEMKRIPDNSLIFLIWHVLCNIKKLENPMEEGCIYDNKPI